jgi:hypothetical protein
MARSGKSHSRITTKATSTREMTPHRKLLLMAQLSADYTDMTVEHTDIWSSEHFEAKGFPCIGLYDGADTIWQVDISIAGKLLSAPS